MNSEVYKKPTSLNKFSSPLLFVINCFIFPHKLSISLVVSPNAFANPT